MRRSRFSEEQKVKMLREAKRITAPTALRWGLIDSIIPEPDPFALSCRPSASGLA
jgi:acetyl-CoA carboxylase alpha subunit